jgi:secreted PhoX family phosphatase
MALEHDNGVSNPSANRPFEDVLASHLSRRTVLAGGLTAAALAFMGSSAVVEAGVPEVPMSPGRHRGGSRRRKRPVIDFAPAPNPGGPNPTISDDYRWDVVIPWGSPLLVGGTDIDGGRPASEAEALKQIGIGHDGMHFFPIRRRNDLGVLCINHEFGDNTTVLGKERPESLEEVRISQAVHGNSVVKLRKRRGTWGPTKSRLNRRITPNTPVTFDGPVAGHPLLDNPAGNAPAGTVNNCANGWTPWGTYLTCEENFNGYFGANEAFTPTEMQSRYGFAEDGFGYGWHDFDPRWDLTNPDYVNESHRFGWIVEIDPWRPWSKPVKHTALGRVKHEGIALTVGKGGRVVGYMGDDERFDYIYKFVSAGSWTSMRAKGISPLSQGTLYVARFDDDGTGEWLELTIDNPVLAAEFPDQASVLTFARRAGDLLGATPMDRPEWTAVAPNGDVYCTLTNNSRRTEPNAANPLAPNPDGHIIRWRDSHRHCGRTFEWDIFLIAADTHGGEDAFGSPDGLWVDPDGRVFIQTDGGQPYGNNQMLVADPKTGDLRRLFAGVEGDEITGITVTPDRRTMFINTQHPGNGDPTATNFPIPGAGGSQIPRDATFVITRKDGGVIGS